MGSTPSWIGEPVYSASLPPGARHCLSERRAEPICIGSEEHRVLVIGRIGGVHVQPAAQRGQSDQAPQVLAMVFEHAAGAQRIDDVGRQQRSLERQAPPEHVAHRARALAIRAREHAPVALRRDRRELVAELGEPFADRDQRVLWIVRRPHLNSGSSRCCSVADSDCCCCYPAVAATARRHRPRWGPSGSTSHSMTCRHTPRGRGSRERGTVLWSWPRDQQATYPFHGTPVRACWPRSVRARAAAAAALDTTKVLRSPSPPCMSSCRGHGTRYPDR